MSSIESRYIHHLDMEKQRIPGQGKATEEAVISFFKTAFPNMEIRPATPQEDAGEEQGGKMVDAIAYLDKKPALALQITSTIDKDQKLKKMQELMDHPTVRFEETKPQDPPADRILVYVDAKEVKELSQDKDLSKHPQIGKNIFESMLLSLTVSLRQTKNPKEIERLRQRLAMVEESRRTFEQNKKGKAN